MPRRLPPWLVRAAWAISVAGLGAVGLSRVWGPVPDKDFSLFYQAARFWLDHGEPGGLAWYHPFALRAFAPLGWLPSQWAGVLWVGMNLACLVGAARLAGEEARWWRSEIVPLLVLLTPWFVEFFVNQFVPPILLLLLLAQRELGRERPLRAGGWLGLAILLKLSPAVLLLWLLLKRDWRALASTVGVVLLFGPGLDVLTVGWDRAVDWQWEWYQRLRWSGSAWTVLVAGSQCEFSNHAVVAILRRLLHPTDSTPHFDVEVGGRHELAGSPPVNLLNLPISAVTVVWAALMLVSLVALVAVSRRPARQASRERLRWEYALYCLAMLWFLPVVREYHYVWAYPLVSLLVASVRSAWRDSGRFPWQSAPVWGLGVWLVTMALGAPRIAQEFGVPMLGIAALGVAGIQVLRRSGNADLARCAGPSA
jgi:alpha-1,2-mannosyltransferase